MTQIIALAQQNRKEFGRFFKFMVVGTIGAVVDFGILNVLMLTFRAQHVDLGAWHLFGTLTLNGNLTLSNTISFTTAVLSNFIWNRFWTYPESRSKPLDRATGAILYRQHRRAGDQPDRAQRARPVLYATARPTGLQRGQSGRHHRRDVLEFLCQSVLDL